MTTQEAINELQDNISDYPIANIVVWRGHIGLERPNGFVQLTKLNGEIKEFDTGIEMLDWIEEEYIKTKD